MKNNRVPLLVPELGGWRGSTLGWATQGERDLRPELHTERYGLPMHVYRLFLNFNEIDSAAAESDGLHRFIERGGIPWVRLNNKEG
jgi:hypothetical protein